MRLLITGAAGHIGSALAVGLSGEHRLRGLDLREPDFSFPGEFVVGDCADTRVADRAVDGVEAVVHLAGVPSESALPTILHGHVLGTAALLDAMVRSGARRMAFASSNHVVGMTPRTEPVGPGTPPRPDTFYGVGKAAAEALLSLYADRFAISSVAMRIGSFRERPETRRDLATWLSPADCVRMVQAVLTARFEGVRVIYGISANRDAWWDLDAGRALGYEPVDDAAVFESNLPGRPEDEIDGARVGGPFATATYDRPAFDEESP